MNDTIFKLMLLAEEEDVTNPFKGSLNGVQGIIGIVLIVTGLLVIYFGVKVYLGYKFLPEKKQNIPKEDNYLPMEAKVLQKKKTRMPSFNGGEDTELIQWKIGYEIDGEKYTQLIPDDGYSKGDFIKIKYDPDAPGEFYLDDREETEPEEDDEEENTKNSNGIMIVALGVMVAVAGVVLVL